MTHGSPILADLDLSHPSTKAWPVALYATFLSSPPSPYLQDQDLDVFTVVTSASWGILCKDVLNSVVQDLSLSGNKGLKARLRMT